MNRTIKFAVPLGVLALICGCSSSGEGSNPLPNDAEVRIQPGALEFEITEQLDDDGNCLFDPDFYIDQFMTVSVTGAGGSPIGGADLSVSVDFGGNSFSGLEVMQLFDDLNGNGVVDEDAELVSGAGDPLFRTATAEFTGEKMLILRLNLSCAYRGSMQAMSDGFVGRAQIDVVQPGT